MSASPGPGGGPADCIIAQAPGTPGARHDRRKRPAAAAAYERVSNGDSDSTVSVALSAGYFFTDAFQLEGMLEGIWNGDDIYTLTVRPNYHFDIGTTLVPYIGAALGYARVSNGDSDSGLVYGAQAGLKQYLTDSAFLQWEVSYQEWKIFDDFNRLNVSVGLGYNF